ncbi:hypothetical protein F5Y14DRAFT_399362 [Nemania sp. NC0429]|nr:hypothetical protein F5Y14DRAFT_399362 [Nemania sp. NC0429]
MSCRLISSELVFSWRTRASFLTVTIATLYKVAIGVMPIINTVVDFALVLMVSTKADRITAYAMMHWNIHVRYTEKFAFEDEIT